MGILAIWISSREFLDSDGKDLACHDSSGISCCICGVLRANKHAYKEDLAKEDAQLATLPKHGS
jgi:hypothetical protein